MKELKPKKLAKGKPKCVNALEHANRIISSNEINHSQRVKKVKQQQSFSRNKYSPNPLKLSSLSESPKINATSGSISEAAAIVFAKRVGLRSSENPDLVLFSSAVKICAKDGK